MRNLSELIGIIKGISFDGIINDKEVECLQNWVDKNRNLSYDKKQAVMIKLVDAALEDRVITDEERDQLLAYSEEYLKNDADENSSIYELNGIITGIISDGVVNADEVIKLKQWLDENSYAIRGHKPSEEILALVEEILEDGIVTEKEQEQLLKLLSARINDTQLKTKINHLKQLVRERKNIGLDLIDILDNEEAINEIHREAETKLGIALRSYSGILSKYEDREIVFISLCLIAMLEYDGNYYDHVADTYKSIYQKYKHQKIEGAIRNILAHYLIDDNTSRLINVALANAIVPARFLSAFFEFIFDIYKLNFGHDIPSDLFEEFRFVYDGLSDVMNSDSDDIQVNVTKKTYKLIQSTKRLITDRENIDAVIRLSVIIVKLIDKRFWGKAVKIFNPYLKEGYEEWEKTLIINKNGINRESDGRRSRWMARFELDGNDIYLVPPVHRVKSRYAFYKIMAIAKNGDEIICLDNRPEIREIIGGYQVSPKRIKLANPLGEIQYQLKAGGEIIYDSKDILYRNYIVFNEAGKELKNNFDYEGLVHVCSFDDGTHGAVYYRTKKYKLSVLKVVYGDLLSFGNEVFSFSSLTKPGVFGDKREYQFLMPEGTEDLLPVFSKVKFLVFEHENNVNNFIIAINQKYFRLEDFHCTKTVRQTSSKYVVDLDIRDPGIYALEVYALHSGSKKRVYNFHFGFDPEYKLTEAKIDSNHYALKVKSGLYNGTIDKEINIANYVDDWLKIIIGGQAYTYFLPLRLDIYRLKSSSWKSMSEDLWIEDIKQDTVLQVLGVYANSLSVISETGTEILEKVQGKVCGIYSEIPIGFLTSYKNINKYVVLLFQKDDETVNAVICYNQCYFDKKKTVIKYNPVDRKLMIIPVYYGKGNITLEVTDDSGEIVFKKSQVITEEPMEIGNLQSYVDYKVSFYYKPKGLVLGGKKELLSVRKAFYAWRDLVGYYVRLKSVHYEHKDGKAVNYKEHTFKNVYIFFQEKIAEDTFSGRFLIRKSNALVILKELDKIKIQICSDIINGEIELDITRLGKKLLFDINKNHIIKTAFNNKVTEVDSYTSEMKGVKRF